MCDACAVQREADEATARLDLQGVVSRLVDALRHAQSQTTALRLMYMLSTGARSGPGSGLGAC